ncbi:unnamed protein product [Rhodiola kirilowii]
MTCGATRHDIGDTLHESVLCRPHFLEQGAIQMLKYCISIATKFMGIIL